MMHASPTSLDRFVRRVYRRLVVLRLLEWSGIGFGIGCAVALLSIVTLRNRVEPPLIFAAIIVMIGAGVGFFASLLRRPKIIDAAVEADRQLDLADLLATAWQLEKSPRQEGFEEAVVLLANDRAARLRPRSVVLHRLGVRAWGGIGLAGALVLTVAVFTANPIDTEASTSPFFSQAASKKNQQDRKNSNNTDVSSGRRPNVIGADHPGGEDDPLPGAGKVGDTTSSVNRGQNSDVLASNPNGAGSGAGKSATTPDKAKPLSSGVNSSRTKGGGSSAPGAGNSSESANTTSGNNSSTAAGNSSKSPSVPAWKSESWPAAQEAANSAVSNGRIPPAYHDLVREYFKR